MFVCVRLMMTMTTKMGCALENAARLALDNNSLLEKLEGAMKKESNYFDDDDAMV